MKDARQLALLYDDLEAGGNKTRQLVAPGIRKYLRMARASGCEPIGRGAAVGPAPRGRSPLVVA